jgi:SH3-like domain-containing protein
MFIIRRSIGSGSRRMAVAADPLPGRGQGVLRRLRVPLASALLAAAGIAALPAFGAENDPGARLPRFVSLRSDQVNLRVGPGQTYPIKWVLTRKGMPVEIVKEFQNWRMVRVWHDASGWILDRLVTAERHVIVSGAIRSIYRRPDPASGVVARAEPGVLAKLAECQGDWCRIEAGGYRGWVKREDVWGVLPGETVP